MTEWRDLGVNTVRRDGDMYYMAFDENTCLNLEQAICLQIRHYEDSVREHINCDLKSEVGCKVALNSKRPHETGCAEDLMFLYGELGKLHRLLYDLREARGGRQSDWATQQYRKIRHDSSGFIEDLQHASTFVSGFQPAAPVTATAKVPPTSEELRNGEPPTQHGEQHRGDGVQAATGENRPDQGRVAPKA